jgi:hypothetical protein
MTVAQLIAKLQELPPDAIVNRIDNESYCAIPIERVEVSAADCFFAPPGLVVIF